MMPEIKEGPDLPMTYHSSAEIIEFVKDVQHCLFNMPFHLRVLRAKVASIEEFARGGILERSIQSEVGLTVIHYYPLPEMIAMYREQQHVFQEHVENGDLDDSLSRNVLILDAYYLCCNWLEPGSRYPYGDVRLLRPIIGEVLVQSAEWTRSPYPEQHGALGEWYEELAPGGSLYPSDEHLDYVSRFEAFAEDILWDSRGQEYITIRNFPAPPHPQPLTDWWCTQHILE